MVERVVIWERVTDEVVLRVKESTYDSSEFGAPAQKPRRRPDYGVEVWDGPRATKAMAGERKEARDRGRPGREQLR